MYEITVVGCTKALFTKLVNEIKDPNIYISKFDDFESAFNYAKGKDNLHIMISEFYVKGLTLSTMISRYAKQKGMILPYFVCFTRLKKLPLIRYIPANPDSVFKKDDSQKVVEEVRRYFEILYRSQYEEAERQVKEKVDNNKPNQEIDEKTH